MKNILSKALFISASIIFITSSASALDCSDPNTSCSAVGSIQLSARVCVDLPKTLSKGMESSHVLVLQNFLVGKGLLKANPTGYFGVGTFNAVKAYQKSVGIQQTGTVGVLTRASIKKDTCSVIVTPDIKDPKTSYKIDSSQPTSDQKVNSLRYNGETSDSLIGSSSHIIKALSDFQTQAKSYFDSNGKTYTGFCDNADIKAKINSIRIFTPFPMECNSSSTEYAVSSHLLYNNYFWCIDSTGFASTSATVLGKNTFCVK